MNDLKKIMLEIDQLVLEYLELGGDPYLASQQLQELSDMIVHLESVDPETLN